MVRFIPADDLKYRYDVFGHFYSVEVTRNQFAQCRSVLEIVEQADTPDESSVLSKRKPDAVFIMMNPGSSRPLVDRARRCENEGVRNRDYGIEIAARIEITARIK